MDKIKKKQDEELKDETNNNRRSFLKKVAIGTAFAIPVIQSFSKNDILVKSALAATPESAKSGESFEVLSFIKSIK